MYVYVYVFVPALTFGTTVARRLSFRVCDVGIQAILARADRDLLALVRALGLQEHCSQLEEWIARGAAAFARLKHEDGTFRSLDLRTKRLSPHVTSATFLCLCGFPYARAFIRSLTHSLAPLAAGTRVRRARKRRRITQRSSGSGWRRRSTLCLPWTPARPTWRPCIP